MDDGSLRKGWWDPTQPLGMPPGSIRALLTIVLIGATATIYVIHKWAPPELITLTTAAIMSYFQTRGAETNGGGK